MERKERMGRRLTDEGWQPLISRFVHEAKAPLTAILGYTSLTQDALRHTQLDDASEYLVIVRESALRQLKILNSLSMLARLEEGQLSLRLLDVAAVWHNVIAEYTRRHSDYRIILTTAEKRGMVNADMHLHDVYEALLDNACRFSPAGSEINITVECPGAEVRVAVTDPGVGIPADEIASVFDPFYSERATPQPANADQYAHIGLSLYMARLFTELNHGRISVESQPEHGTTFTLSLPAASVA